MVKKGFQELKTGILNHPVSVIATELWSDKPETVKIRPQATQIYLSLNILVNYYFYWLYKKRSKRTLTCAYQGFHLLSFAIY